MWVVCFHRFNSRCHRLSKVQKLNTRAGLKSACIEVFPWQMRILLFQILHICVNSVHDSLPHFHCWCFLFCSQHLLITITFICCIHFYVKCYYILYLTLVLLHAWVYCWANASQKSFKFTCNFSNDLYLQMFRVQTCLFIFYRMSLKKKKNDIRYKISEIMLFILRP